MRIKKAVMDGMPPTAVFCVIGSAVATAKTVIQGIFDGGMTMSECFAGGHLRFVDGEWRDNDGNAIEISRVRHGRWISLTECANEGVYCSICKKKVWKSDYALCSHKSRNKLRSDYCPNCGAKMDGGDGNSDIA